MFGPSPRSGQITRGYVCHKTEMHLVRLSVRVLFIQFVPHARTIHSAFPALILIQYYCRILHMISLGFSTWALRK